MRRAAKQNAVFRLRRLRKNDIKQEAPKSIMGRRATSIHLLGFSVAIRSQQETGTLGQVPTLGCWPSVLEKCTSSLNGLRVYLLDQNKVRSFKWIIVFQKIASWLQIAMTFPSFNSLAEKHSQKSSKIASFFFPAMAVSTGVKQKSRVFDQNDGGLHVPVK